MIVVYADESGTHHPEGKLPGSEYPVIAGFAAQKSVWNKFRRDWGWVLRKYEVDYFHSKELRAAREAIVHKKEVSKELQKNPYYCRRWNINKIENFRRDLARVAAEGDKIPIVGNVLIPEFTRRRPGFLEQNPYKICMRHFFQGCFQETRLQWKQLRDEFVFVFDQNPKKEWVLAVHEVFSEFEKAERMSGPHFGNKKKALFWPLQAADLLAYRCRQLLEDYHDGGQRLEAINLEKFDNILLSNLNKSGAIKYPELAPLLRNKNKR